MNVTIENNDGREVICCTGLKDKRYLRADRVYIRASDGAVMIGSGKLRSKLTAEERAMAEALPLVKRLTGLAEV